VRRVLLPNQSTRALVPATEVGAARPTRSPPLEMADEGKLTTSWISPLPTKDLMNGSGAHELRDDDRLVTVHSPFGHCVAYLTKQRVKLLWRWICETNPEDGTLEKFAIETAAMSVRIL